jgi:hypothetical protein
MIIVGAHRSFVRSIMHGETRYSLQVYSCSVMMGVLDEDFFHLREGATTPELETILAGLLSTNTLRVINSNELEANPIGKLSHWDQGYLMLAIVCNRCICTSESASNSDEQIFCDNTVSLIEDERDLFSLLFKRKMRIKIQNEWILKEGGTLTITDVMGNELTSAKRVRVFDRYFKNETLICIEKALTDIKNKRGRIDCVVEIFCGDSRTRKNTKNNHLLSSNDIKSRLGYLFDDPAQLACFEVVKTPEKLLIHDRFIEIDSYATYIFTAGIACFNESLGANRSSAVIKVSPLVNPENFSFEARQDDKVTMHTIKL